MLKWGILIWFSMCIVYIQLLWQLIVIKRLWYHHGTTTEFLPTSVVVLIWNLWPSNFQDSCHLLALLSRMEHGNDLYHMNCCSIYWCTPGEMDHQTDANMLNPMNSCGSWVSCSTTNGYPMPYFARLHIFLRLLNIVFINQYSELFLAYCQ